MSLMLVLTWSPGASYAAGSARRHRTVATLDACGDRRGHTDRRQHDDEPPLGRAGVVVGIPAGDLDPVLPEQRHHSEHRARHRGADLEPESCAYVVHVLPLPGPPKVTGCSARPLSLATLRFAATSIRYEVRPRMQPLRGRKARHAHTLARTRWLL